MKMKRSKNNSGKRSQISFFILIGLSIILLSGLIFFIYSNAQSEDASVSQFSSVRNYLEECVKNRAEHGLNLIGVQGGYIKLPENHLAANYSRIAYGLYNNQNNLPSLGVMESELENYIDNALPSCINVSVFPYLKFEYENSSSDVSILTNEVFINVRFPISIIQGEATTNIDSFNIQVPIRLGYIHSILKSIIGKTLLENNWIDLAYLSRFDVKIDVLPNDENSIVYSVQDYKSVKPYVFLSAFYFKPNQAPVINIENKIELPDGELFLKRVNVTDPEADSFECSEDTALFDITYDCIILFTPEIPGDYNVTISALDARGNRAYKSAIFEVGE